MSTTKAWIGKRNGEKKYTRVYGDSWLEVYKELEEKGIISYYEYIPYEKAVAEKNDIDWEEYEEFLGDEYCDIYEYAKQKGIELVDLTDEDIKSLIYDETNHEWNCEMIEFKYSIENKWHNEVDICETLEEAKETLAEYEEIDKAEGNFEEDCYRIIDLATGKEVEMKTMKIPKHIQDKINKAESYASKTNALVYEIEKWMQKQGIDETIARDDCGGVGHIISLDALQEYLRKE